MRLFRISRLGRKCSQIAENKISYSYPSDFKDSYRAIWPILR
jgi:hypothetical protein